MAGLFVIPLVKLQAAFDHHRPAFFEILADNLGLAAEGVHIHEGGFLLFLAFFIRPRAVDGHAELGDGGAAGGVFHLGIAGEVAH